MVRAHRIAYEIAYGKPPDFLYVCHRCDNPKCINPSHLFLGTQDDNMKDMSVKRRSIFGEKNPKAKLTENAVKMIRQKLKEGFSHKQLANEFGVTRTAISHILKGKIWRHVT